MLQNLLARDRRWVHVAPKDVTVNEILELLDWNSVSDSVGTPPTEEEALGPGVSRDLNHLILLTNDHVSGSFTKEKGLHLKPLTSVFGVHSKRHIEDGVQLFEGLLLGFRQEEKDL